MAVETTECESDGHDRTGRILCVVSGLWVCGSTGLRVCGFASLLQEFMLMYSAFMSLVHTSLYDTSAAADRRLFSLRQALRRGCLLGFGHPPYGDVVLAGCTWWGGQREIGRPCWSPCLARRCRVDVGGF